MSIDPKIVELTANVLGTFFQINKYCSDLLRHLTIYAAMACSKTFIGLSIGNMRFCEEITPGIDEHKKHSTL